MKAGWKNDTLTRMYFENKRAERMRKLAINFDAEQQMQALDAEVKALTEAIARKEAQHNHNRRKH